MSMLLAVRNLDSSCMAQTDCRPGQSVFLDPVSKRDVMVYHYVKASDAIGGASYLGINYLDFSSGWPVVVS